jgi:3-oxoacyl-[acyl-carrier protein] reductase
VGTHPLPRKTPGGAVGIPNVEALARQQAIKRAGTAKDIVGRVLFLFGDSSDFVTGQTSMADGGLYRL